MKINYSENVGRVHLLKRLVIVLLQGDHNSFEAMRDIFSVDMANINSRELRAEANERIVKYQVIFKPYFLMLLKYFVAGDDG